MYCQSKLEPVSGLKVVKLDVLHCKGAAGGGDLVVKERLFERSWSSTFKVLYVCEQNRLWPH